MTGEFRFEHLSNPAALGDPMHLHSYSMTCDDVGEFSLSLASRLSTDVEGIASCLGLQAEARVELAEIIARLELKISPATRFRPV